VLPAGGGELLSWDLADLPPQARERHSWKVYNEDGKDGDEGSDGEGPIFKGMAGSSRCQTAHCHIKQRFMCPMATSHRCTDVVWCGQSAPAVHSSDVLQHCEYWQWVPDATFVGKCSDSSWQQVRCADGASTAATKLLLCV
jgi:hypothetical protein